LSSQQWIDVRQGKDGALVRRTLQRLSLAGKKAVEYITQVTALGPPGLEFSMPPTIRAK
jgi:hypothetical protein